MNRVKTLVLGATGNVGQHLLSLLTGTGMKVCAGIHSGENADLSPFEHCSLLDYADIDSLVSATRNMRQVSVIIPDSPHMELFATNIVRACEQNGVDSYVLVSGAGVTASPNNAVSKRLMGMEDAFTTSLMNGVILRPVFFMQNFIHHHPPTTDGKIILPMEQGKVNYIDARDVALACHKALEMLSVAGPNENRTCYLTGAHSYTMSQVAEAFSETLGRPYQYVSVSIEDAILQMKIKGLADWRIAMMSEIFQSAQQDAYHIYSDDFLKLTGNRPTRLTHFIKDYKRHFLYNYQLNQINQ